MEGCGWRPLKAVCASASAIGMLLALSAAPSEATPAPTSPGLSSCGGMFKGTPPGSLVEITSAGPDDSLVVPGQVITVTMTWDPTDFSGIAPERTEDCVEIGANVTIDRATIGSTLIRKGAKLDNLIQIAHNVDIGNDTVIAAQAGISGSTKIGSGVMIGGQAGIVGHLQIADGRRGFAYLR